MCQIQGASCTGTVVITAIVWLVRSLRLQIDNQPGSSERSVRVVHLYEHSLSQYQEE